MGGEGVDVVATTISLEAYFTLPDSAREVDLPVIALAQHQHVTISREADTLVLSWRDASPQVAASLATCTCAIERAILGSKLKRLTTFFHAA